MSTCHGREEFLLRVRVILFLVFFFPLSEIASIFPRAATLTALLILHHVLVRREQMPLDDRRVFSVVTISVLGTSETKCKPSSSHDSALMASTSCEYFLAILGMLIKIQENRQI